jgi:HTH-type transcriptional regulator / antitoxin HigA
MEAVMNQAVLQSVAQHFTALSAFIPLNTIRNARDYRKAVVALNQLLDSGAADEKHPLANLVDTLGALIGEYDEATYLPPQISTAALIRFLMDQHQMTQADLPEVGSQGVVSELLSGKRSPNVRQIKALAVRFNVPASVFI